VFLLNNIHDRDYRAIYSELDDVIFDMSDAQLSNSRNGAWHDITQGSIVCVVKNSRKISTFYQVETKHRTEVTDDNGSYQNVIVGPVVAKLASALDMTYLLNKCKVKHSLLPDNKMSIGFNVADLGDSLGELEVITREGSCHLSLLEP
jgi:hypothetical protein